MTVDLDHIVNEAQDAYRVSPNAVVTYAVGGYQLHRSMPRNVRDKSKLEAAPLARMNALYKAHDYIDGVLQPLVSSLHDVTGEKQTPLRKLDRHRDVELQANYGPICETGLPLRPDEARQSVRDSVERGQPVLVARAQSDKTHSVPIQLGHLENQTYEEFRKSLDGNVVEEAKKRSRTTGATGISNAKRGTLISPQHLYLHQVKGDGSLEKSTVQRRMADYFTLQLPGVDDTEEAYEILRSQHNGGMNPFISYLFEAFEDINGSSPIDPARSIDW